MAEDNNHKNYSAAEIRLYLEGKLGADEMHAMEKAALADPFLAAAMEGLDLYAQQPETASFEQDTDDLRRRLQERAGKDQSRTGAPARRFWWAAAAVLILVLSGIAISLFVAQRPGRPGELADKTAPPDSGRTTGALLQGKQEDSDLLPAAAPHDMAKSADAEPAKQVESRPDKEAKKRLSYRKSTPASGAGTSTAKRSDSLEMPSRDEVAAPVRSIMSRERKEQAAAFDQEIDSEIVAVVGAQQLSERAAEANDARRIVPAGGWKAFEDYVNRHKATSKADTLSPGREEIHFSINSNGRPAEIVVVSSLSPRHDANALNLLSEGPSWNVVAGRNRNVRLIIIY